MKQITTLLTHTRTNGHFKNTPNVIHVSQNYVNCTYTWGMQGICGVCRVYMGHAEGAWISTVTCWMIISSKENDKQIKSNLRTSIYCKIHLVANMV